MKRSILLLSALLSLSISNAQQTTIPLEKWCMTSHRMEALQQDAEMISIFQQDEITRNKEALNGTVAPKGTVYKIPVVFHIVHNNGPENIAVSQILNALDVINRDFRLQNADTASIEPTFWPIMADVEVEFVLATIAPNGECFKGWTRTVSTTTYAGGGSDGDDQVDAVRIGNDVYQGNWPAKNYLNVYVVSDCGGAGGYTQYPYGSGNDMSQGIWILHTQFSEIGTSGTSAGRSLTHEIGHWLNLPHTWGSTNTPGMASNCSMDDGISDTPLTAGVSGGCPITQADCGPLANVHNYMDYALSCQSMFTQGQKTEMRQALLSAVGGRNNLWTSSNLAATGADGSAYLCDADFKANKTTVCVGDTIHFTDESFNAVTGWTWDFPGGTPATSSAQNPQIAYTTPGIYSVTLTASDGVNNDAEAKTSYIRVYDTGATLPFIEDFEGYSTLNNVYEWEIFNENNNAKWELETAVGHTGTQSARLMNSGQTVGSFDELISSPVDLTTATTSLTMSFRYAYKRKNVADDDWFRVWVTSDCGDNWAIRKTLHGAQLSSSFQTTSFTPASINDWTTVHMTNLTNVFWVDNFRYRFTFEAGGGNNMFIDNINIYASAPSDDLVIGLEEQEGPTQLSLYPNPADNELNVEFNLNQAMNGSVAIMDLSGKTVQHHVIQANEGSNRVFMGTQDISAGMYLLKVQFGDYIKTLHFVVQ